MAKTRVPGLALASGSALLLGIVLLSACSETRKGLGGSCIKDEDCLTGICSQLVCVSAPPLLDAEVEAPDAGASTPDATTPKSDAGPTSDATVDDAPSEAADEASTVSEAGPDAPPDVQSSSDASSSDAAGE